MNKLNFWNEISGIGKLYIEKELVVGVEPVLFVCTVDENTEQRYLIMTYDSYEGVYVMRKIDKGTLLDMLENRCTMEETFRLGKEIYKTYFDKNDDMKCDIFIAEDFDANLLPRKNEYFELRSRHILSYIDILKKISYHDVSMELIYPQDEDGYASYDNALDAETTLKEYECFPAKETMNSSGNCGLAASLAAAA